MIKKTLYWLSKSFAWILVTIVLLLSAIYLALRLYFLPQIHTHKDEIAQRITKIAQQKITIGDVRASWIHANPVLAMAKVTVYDAQNRPALTFDHIVTELSWKSLSSLEPRLSKLVIYSPQLTIRREKDGNIFIAGIPIAGESKPDLANWLLRQGRIEISDASVIWQDDYRQAPPLALDHLDFHLDRPVLSRFTGQHAFDLVAKPSLGTPHPIHVDGTFYGHDASDLTEWHGELNAELRDADLAIWKQWLDYPIDIQTGFGSTKLNMHFAENRVDRMIANVAIRDVSSRLKQNNKIVNMQELSGQLSLASTKNTTTFEAKDIKLTTGSGLNVQNGYARYANKSTLSQPSIEANIKLDSITLESLQEFAEYAPIPAEKIRQLQTLNPKGILKQFRLDWSGDQTQAKNYQLSSFFNGLSIQSDGTIPGFSNLSGEISANEREGTLKLDTHKAVLDLKNILRWPLPIDTLQGDVSWRLHDGKTVIASKDLAITNPHLSGKVNASYTLDGTNGDAIDLEGNFGKGNAKFAPFYYPIILGTPTLHWLDTSILSGRAEDIKVIIKGKIRDFPFTNKQHQLDKKLGIFRVTAKVSDVLMEYGTGWPLIENLAIDLLFEGKRMELNSSTGHVFGNRILKSKTEIPRLDADWPILNITGEIEGPVTEGIKFVNQSPVKEVTMGFTDNLKAAGNGKLLLELNIPMQDLESSKYKGAYQISNGTIHADESIGLPQLDSIQGVLNFTEKSLTATGINTQIFNEPAQLSLTAGQDKVIRINANGKLGAVGISRLTQNELAKHLSGSTNWSCNVVVKKPQTDISISSNLVGLSIDLPAPLTKTATASMPLRLEKTQLNSTSTLVNLKIGEQIQGKFLQRLENNLNQLERGAIAFNAPVNLPETKGLSVTGKLDTLNLDAWRNVFSAPSTGTQTNPGINNLNLEVGTLVLFNKEIHQLKLAANPAGNGWKSNIQSHEASGDVEWNPANNGKIIARLEKLLIPASKENDSNTTQVVSEPNKPVQNYPALDVIAQQFDLGSKKLGKLELVAFPNNDDWSIQRLNITNQDHSLQAEGVWHQWTRNPNTRLQFKWSISNVGRTLKALGQPDTIKSGTAELNGQLQWDGSPHQFETRGLDGSFSLQAQKGQIIKVQPGVGRLFGLLSLQSLPRRLTLDFRDLFSDGFAFDKISANATIKNGVMRSDDFFMTGPAAEVNIKGETDLQKETQNLNVKILPHVSDSASLAAFAGGPVAGVAAFVAQKLLKDPLNKIASTEYQIVGTWDNPREINAENNKTNQENDRNPIK